MITQKKYLNSIGLLVALITGVLFLPGLSHADVAVIKEYDFGEVEVLTSTPESATLDISSSNPDVQVFITGLTLENNCGFSISAEVPLPIALPESININYVPLSPGDCQSTLLIYTSDRNTAEVILSGTGVITTQEITIEGILFFFDSCVAEGKLEGYVPDKSNKKRSADKITKDNGSDKLAENRLNALRNMIEKAGVLIDSEKIDEACGQLEAAYKKIKMDGLNTPGSSSFFVKGIAASELADDVQELMGTLRCK
jgi:hypothetical protein